MQTNNDTHGPENKFSSTWCREFGAAGPRQTHSYMHERAGHASTSPGHSNELPSQDRDPRETGAYTHLPLLRAPQGDFPLFRIPRKTQV